MNELQTEINNNNNNDDAGVGGGGGGDDDERRGRSHSNSKETPDSSSFTSDTTLTSSASSSKSSTPCSSSSSLLSNHYHYHSAHHKNNLSDWIELSDENLRLKKLYDKLRSEHNDLEIRYENLHLDEQSLLNLFQQQKTQIYDLKKRLDQSIDLSVYETIYEEMDQLKTEINDLTNENKSLKRRLKDGETELNRLQPLVDELNEQNETLREQIHNYGNHRDITAKLLCDIDSMQNRINEYLISITNLSDENQELRNLIEQYRIEHSFDKCKNRSSISTTTSHSFVEMLPSTLSLSSASTSRQNSVRSAAAQNNQKTSVFKPSETSAPLTRCSYSNLNLSNLNIPRSESTNVTKSSQAMETMADVKINDLEQQIKELEDKLTKVEKENQQFKEWIQNTSSQQQQHLKSQTGEVSSTLEITAETCLIDQFAQTDPIELTIVSKKIIRCPLDHRHNSQEDYDDGDNHLNGDGGSVAETPPLLSKPRTLSEVAEAIHQTVMKHRKTTLTTTKSNPSHPASSSSSSSLVPKCSKPLKTTFKSHRPQFKAKMMMTKTRMTKTIIDNASVVTDGDEMVEQKRRRKRRFLCLF